MLIDILVISGSYPSRKSWLESKRRFYASCLNETAQLFKQVVKAEEVIDFGRARHAVLERRLARSVYYNRSLEGQLQCVGGRV